MKNNKFLLNYNKPKYFNKKKPVILNKATYNDNKVDLHFNEINLTYAIKFNKNQSFFNIKNRHFFFKYLRNKKNYYFNIDLPKIFYKNFFYFNSLTVNVQPRLLINYLNTSKAIPTSRLKTKINFFYMLYYFKKSPIKSTLRKAFNYRKNPRIKKYHSTFFKKPKLVKHLFKFSHSYFFHFKKKYLVLNRFFKTNKHLAIFRKNNHTLIPKLLVNFIRTKDFHAIKISGPMSYFTILKKTTTKSSITKKLRFFSNNPIVTKFRYRFKVYSSINVSTTHKCFFILFNTGLIFPLKFTYKSFRYNLYLIKKKTYSFLKINEFKIQIFNSKKKSILWRLLFSRERKIFKDTNQYRYNFFTRKTSQNNINYKPIDLLYKISNTFQEKKNNLNNFFGEVRINRVRFKPGYQRLWRNYRLALSDIIDYKYLYQKQLTKYITKFYRKVNQFYLTQNENVAYRIIIYSKLIPDYATLKIFLKSSLIFLNGRSFKNPQLFLYKNDIIQLEVSNWYYIFFRWLSNFTKIRNLKFKKLVFRKSLSSKYKIMKQRKQKSNYTPNWITNIKYDFLDVKSFLEVDYLTLSVFVLYDHNYVTYYTPTNARVMRYNIYKMYNWKYIN